ncbi:TPA: hypothetical protein PXN90_001372 [Yersinia enterocolitica]|nr:hypothetical protein [Yersinia enterocolitica]
MGIPKNYRLKGYVDHSQQGHVETYFQSTFSSKEETLTSCVLSPSDVFILVERLYWTSIDGEIIYKVDGSNSKIVLKYPFSRFWETITDNFAIAQHSEKYELPFQIKLREKLKLDSLSFPHFIKITLSSHSIGDEFDKIKISPHNADIDHFECRSDIISRDAYVEGMLYKIISDSKKLTSKPIDNMTFNEKITFCKKTTCSQKSYFYRSHFEKTKK